MPSSKNNTISRRLIWMNLLASGAALLLACAAFTAYDVITFRAAMARNLSIQAHLIGTNSTSALLFGDPEAAKNTLSALQAAPHILSATIFTPDGHSFASYRRDGVSQLSSLPEVPAGQQEAHWFQSGQLILVRSIVFQGSTVGTVRIRSDLSELTSRLQRYALIVIVVLLVSLIAALLVSRIAQRAISRPIVHLAEVARAVSRDKNYSVRAASSGGRGELALLVEAFNEMLTQIHGRDAELRKARSELEQRVEERTTQLAATNKELEAFSYSVSHDLRAPLRSIDGFSQALLEDYGDKLDDSGQDHLRRVRAATQRMSVLIDDMLNLSRVTRSEMRTESVDLTGMAKTIADELHKGDADRQVHFVIAGNLKASGDARLLRVVMENLIGNAWKYTSKHPTARIEFGRQGTNGKTAFFVRDDGAGFDPQYSDRLFGAFQRLHGMTDFPGTGVGLATVQRIIRRHGGDVWAESAVEKGATFYFTLQTNGGQVHE